MNKSTTAESIRFLENKGYKVYHLNGIYSIWFKYHNHGKYTARELIQFAKARMQKGFMGGCRNLPKSRTGPDWKNCSCCSAGKHSEVKKLTCRSARRKVKQMLKRVDLL